MTANCVLAAAAVLALASCSQAAGLTLVKNGRSDYKIVLPKGSSPSEHRAAAELEDHIRQISGAMLPVVREKSGPSILLGSAAHADISGLGDEGFVIKTDGEDLLIAGGRLRGTMYGVYYFLEDVLGCRWYSPKVSKIPKTRTIRIPDLDISEIPAFEYRDIFYTHAFDKDWAARNRTNGSWSRLDRSTGGKLMYGRWCHTFAALVPLDKYWDTHPEYYSMVKGERIREGTQLCLTNPDVVRIATETVLRWVEDNPEARIFSVSQNDWGNPCECEKCATVVEEEGSQSGPLLHFVNAIGTEVAKTHPNILIDTIAYQYTEDPPRNVRPLDNVRIRLCTYWSCNSHPFETCENSAKALANLKAWSAITDKLYVWHYNTGFSHYLIPFPNFEGIAGDADMYRRHGVKGMFWQGNGSAGGGGEFAELRAWVLAKLSWNTKADTNALIDEFMADYYGKSAPYIRQYFDLLHQYVREKNMHMWIGMYPDAPLFSPEIIAESVRLFDLAEKAADSPDILQRVRKERLGIDYVQLMRPIIKKETAGREEELLQQLDTLVARCREYGITNVSESDRLDVFYAGVKEKLE